MGIGEGEGYEPPERPKFNLKYALDLPMWEIFVPASNRDVDFSYEHHKIFDEFVKQKAQGITVMRGAKGEWISPSGELFKDRIIPCRICCSVGDIHSIMQFALKHYNQEAIMAYKVSDHVYMIRKQQGSHVKEK